MTERDDLLASIAETIKDYRAGEIPQPTPDHVDRWISQFDSDVQVPMLRELDYVFKQTYVSKEKAQELFGGIASNFDCDFWRSAHILDVQQNGRSQREINELFIQVLRKQCDSDINFIGSPTGEFVYLDDAIFTGNRVIEDLSHWTQSLDLPRATLHIMVIALHRGGTYWIGRNKERWTSGKEINLKTWRFNGFEFENRRYYRDQSDVLWPTADVYSEEGFQPRTAGATGSKLFASEQGRSLLEKELLKAGLAIQGFANNPAFMLKPLGFYRFNPGFGSLFVTYRNCPNNAPLALWWGDPEHHPPHHPLAQWYPLFSRKTYEQIGGTDDLDSQQTPDWEDDTDILPF